ncbi:MAG: hypothetical protein S4CHLAM20_08270 [Chlamydiia bacterium]|nr:hypothetical protein [Chlamydiia bacterium]
MTFFCLLLASMSMFNKSDPKPEAYYKVEYKPKGPHLTGPILTGPGYIPQKGHFDFEPYVVIAEPIESSSHGRAAKHQIKPAETTILFRVQLGLTDNIAFSLYPYVTSTVTDGVSKLAMGDLVLGPSFQIFRDNPKYYNIAMKFGINQLIPCGTAENLDPLFNGNDEPTLEAWSTMLYAAASKLFHINRENFFDLRTEVLATFYFPNDVHGLTSVGGDGSTNGVLSRGPSFTFLIGMELSLDLHWALALDIENQYNMASSFEGTTIQPVGNVKDSYLLAFAPGIEYNFHEHLGIIGGVWIGAYGVNIEEFLNIVIALNWYH